MRSRFVDKFNHDDEAPGYDDDVATGLADAQHLRDHGLGIREVMKRVARGDAVEALIVEGKLFHDAVCEPDVLDPRLQHELLPLRDHRVGSIEPHNRLEVRRQRPGELSRTRRDVQAHSAAREWQSLQHPLQALHIGVSVSFTGEARRLGAEDLSVLG